MKKTLNLAMSTLLLMGVLVTSGFAKTIEPQTLQPTNVEASGLQLVAIDPPILQPKTIDPPILRQ